MAESKLNIADRDVVVPGEVLATGMEYLPSQGTHRNGEEILAQRVGLARVDGKVIKIIPLSGRYIPKVNDIIVCKVIDVMMSGWRVDTNSPYSAVLGLKEGSDKFIRKGEDLTRYYDLGDYLAAKVTNVTSQKLVDITTRAPGLKKLIGGRLVEVNAQKVPRIIGKQGSMISMIKDYTGCQITVGQNGIVWLKGEPEMENVAVTAIRTIEENSTKSGLTEEIEKFLTDKTGGKKKESQKSDEDGE